MTRPRPFSPSICTLACGVSNCARRGARGPASSALRQAPARGFSLLELVLVLLLLSIIAGLVAPSLRSFAAGRQTHDAATELATLARFAHTQALSEGVIYRLNLDPVAGSYWVSLQDGGNQSVDLQSDFGQVHQLPEGVRMEAPDAAFEESLQVIRFYPNGRTEAGTIRLTDTRGQVIEVVCPSAAENYRVASAGGGQ